MPKVLDFDPPRPFNQGAQYLARIRLGASQHIQRPRYLLSSETPSLTTFDPPKWNYDLRSDTDPADHHSEWIS